MGYNKTDFFVNTLQQKSKEPENTYDKKQLLIKKTESDLKASRKNNSELRNKLEASETLVKELKEQLKHMKYDLQNEQETIMELKRKNEFFKAENKQLKAQS